MRRERVAIQRHERILLAELRLGPLRRERPQRIALSVLDATTRSFRPSLLMSPATTTRAPMASSNTTTRSLKIVSETFVGWSPGHTRSKAAAHAASATARAMIIVVPGFVCALTRRTRVAGTAFPALT